MSDHAAEPRANFIRSRVRSDLAKGLCKAVVTRFPPEPNGFLHIGHAKAALLNAAIAKEFDGRFLLRMDDTNPGHDYGQYIDAVIEDLKWLGCVWEEPVHFTSDYFEPLFDFAARLIDLGLAYVCDLDNEQMRSMRGTLTEPGVNSPHRERSKEENADLFARMRKGDFPDGARVLRAKIDMAAGNLNMRDPVLYRIRHTAHARTGDRWCIYPTYDFSHCLSDAIEGVTHSLCSLEFEDHRPLYDWLLVSLAVADKPQQIEFARLSIERTVVGKRHLRALVEGGAVDGWDDPRLMTLAGLRRRGCPPAAVRHFCEGVGVAKADNEVRLAQWEHSVRAALEETAPRAMAVLRPVRARLVNWEEGARETLRLPAAGDDSAERAMEFAGEFYMEQEDFSLDPEPGYRRLTPNQSVRLRGAWVVSLEKVECDDAGRPVLLHCRYDPATLGVKPDYKIGGVIHWASALDAVPLTVNVYDALFAEPLAADADLLANVNPSSKISLSDCKGEPALRDTPLGGVRQFERQGYFCRDAAAGDDLVFNRTVSLRAARKAAAS